MNILNQIRSALVNYNNFLTLKIGEHIKNAKKLGVITNENNNRNKTIKF